MPSDANTAPANAAATRHTFEFTGTAGEMWPIVLKNLLLNIITLSFYRFWGRTNVRRYLWSNVRFMGDPLEYTGRGGELFVGFLIVTVVVFLPLVGLLTWAQALMARGEPFGFILFSAGYLLLLWLAPLGLYRAFKYRMSRTRWRGVRGAQTESGVRYATEFFFYTILTVFTAGLLLPFMEAKLYTQETNNRRFGTGRFSFSGSSGPLYSAFLISYALVVGGYVLVFVIAGNLAKLGFVAILGLYLFLGLAFAIYELAKLKHFWNSTKFEGAEFVFNGEIGELIKLYLGNILLTLVTLGIAYPIAQMRVVRFMTEHLVLVGQINLAAVTQSTEAEPGFGEGLAEGFDMGTI